MSKDSGYGWCQSCGALVFNSPQCHKCGGEVKSFCVDITLVQQAERIKKLEALRDTVSISCHPPKDCNDPEVLKTYMKGCFDQSQKLY